MKKDVRERKKLVAAMEYIVRQVNNEDYMYGWLANGVPDGDVPYGDLSGDTIDDYFATDDGLKDVMSCFLRTMVRAYKDGGLYCNGVVSKHLLREE